MTSVVLSTVESDAYVFFNVAVRLSPPLLWCGLRSISNLSSSFASLLFSVIAFLSLPSPPRHCLFFFSFRSYFFVVVVLVGYRICAQRQHNRGCQHTYTFAIIIIFTPC